MVYCCVTRGGSNFEELWSNFGSISIHSRRNCVSILLYIWRCIYKSNDWSLGRTVLFEWLILISLQGACT